MTPFSCLPRLSNSPRHSRLFSDAELGRDLLDVSRRGRADGGESSALRSAAYIRQNVSADGVVMRREPAVSVVDEVGVYHAAPPQRRLPMEPTLYRRPSLDPGLEAAVEALRLDPAPYRSRWRSPRPGAHQDAVFYRRHTFDSSSEDAAGGGGGGGGGYLRPQEDAPPPRSPGYAAGRRYEPAPSMSTTGSTRAAWYRANRSDSRPPVGPGPRSTPASPKKLAGSWEHEPNVNYFFSNLPVNAADLYMRPGDLPVVAQQTAASDTDGLADDEESDAPTATPAAMPIPEVFVEEAREDEDEVYVPSPKDKRRGASPYAYKDHHYLDEWAYQGHSYTSSTSATSPRGPPSRGPSRGPSPRGQRGPSPRAPTRGYSRSPLPKPPTSVRDSDPSPAYVPAVHKEYLGAMGEPVTDYHIESERERRERRQSDYLAESERDRRQSDYLVESERDRRKSDYHIESERDRRLNDYLAESERDRRKSDYHVESERDRRKIDYHNVDIERDRRQSDYLAESERDRRQSDYLLENERDRRQSDYHAESERDRRQSDYRRAQLGGVSPGPPVMGDTGYRGLRGMRGPPMAVKSFDGVVGRRQDYMPAEPEMDIPKTPKGAAAAASGGSNHQALSLSLSPPRRRRKMPALHPSG